jgi:hypothetical protein
VKAPVKYVLFCFKNKGIHEGPGKFQRRPIAGHITLPGVKMAKK